MDVFVYINLFIRATNLTENLLFSRLWGYMSEGNMGPDSEKLIMQQKRYICTTGVQPDAVICMLPVHLSFSLLYKWHGILLSEGTFLPPPLPTPSSHRENGATKLQQRLENSVIIPDG